MKNFSKVFAALLMSAAVLVSCSSAETTTETADSGTAAEAIETAVTETTEAAAQETKEESSASTAASADKPAVASSSGTVIDNMGTWHYKTWKCVYVDGGSGGHFENDEMAEFIASNPEWYKDTAMMSAWDEADGPFGDRIAAGDAARTEWVTDPSNYHGIMFYKTFNVDYVDEAYTYTMNMFYDNTVYIYINGELFFSNDAKCGSGDWTDDYVDITPSDQSKTINDYLRVGENYIAVSLKDCWGGREFDMSLSYEYSATQNSLTFFDVGSEWHYSVFSCPYTDGAGKINGSVAEGYFDSATDEMTAFIAANPHFTTDTDTLLAWPTANAPFDDSDAAVNWKGSNHGIILAKTFTVDDLDYVKTADYFDLFCSYDNAIYVYLNGTPVYVDDGECTIQDWNSGLTHYTSADGTLDNLADLLVAGDNIIVVTVKDSWGGREFDASLSAEWN